MPSFSTRRRVPFSPEQMFALVADVERYPEFLPLCEALKLTSRETRVSADPATGEETVLIAAMTVGYQAIRETFKTRVTLQPSRRRILVEYLDGPFSHLENRWTFKATAPGASEIDFFIDYEMKSRMLGLLVGAVFDKAFRRFAEAFETRAHQIYASAQTAIKSA